MVLLPRATTVVTSSAQRYSNQNLLALRNSRLRNPEPSQRKVTWNYGQEFVTLRLSQTHFSGPLHVVNVDEDDPQASGAVVLILGNDRRRQRAKASSLGKREPWP